MSGERVEKHAELLVDWCTDVREGDAVTILASDPAKELVTALHGELGKRNAEPVTVYGTLDSMLGVSGKPMRAYLRNHEGDFDTPRHLVSLLEESDVFIAVRSETNTAVLSDVSAEVKRQRAEVIGPIIEKLSTKEKVCATQHPTAAWAQKAGMALPEYKDFVYGAMLRDWAAVADEQARLRDRLDEASDARLTGPETDITMRLDGMKAVSDTGEENFPGGEVFTAPVVESVNGEVWFDKPALVQGQEVDGIRLTFDDGVVTEYSAEKNEDALAAVLDTDEGATRVGELGVGMNDGIDRFTRNMLFDEKMGGTIHLALGRAYEDTVGDEREQNRSAVHLDLLKDMSDGRIELDGNIIQDSGKFAWEGTD